MYDIVLEVVRLNVSLSSLITIFLFVIMILYDFVVCPYHCFIKFNGSLSNK